MWTLEEGIEVVNTIREKVFTTGFATALTGGVLYRGHSQKDLDLLFYPLDHTPHDYRFTVQMILHLIETEDFFVIDHKEYKENRVTIVLKLKNGKRIDLFFPSVKLFQRVDNWKTVYRSYREDNPMRQIVSEILAN